VDERALARAQEWFGGDLLRAQVFLRRYALRDLEGRLLEVTPDQMWDRVARHVARAEDDPRAWRARFRGLLKVSGSCPAGGSSSGQGTRAG